MTNTLRDTLEHPTSEVADRPVRLAGMVGGVSLLGVALFGGVGALVAVQGLVTPGDAATTATDILGSQRMFDLGVASLYVTVVLDIVVAWALLRFFTPAGAGLSRLAAWLRLAYSAVFLVAISQLAGIPALLTDTQYAAAFDPEQVQAQALLRTEAFTDIWMAGLVLFGAHLVVLGYLAYRSGYVPKLIGVLLVVAGAGYAFDTFSRVLSPDSPIAVSTVTFVGELLLAVWLVARSRRVTLKAVDDVL